MTPAELDAMTDAEAITHLERELHGWKIRRASSDRCVGQMLDRPNVTASGDTWTNLRHSITAVNQTIQRLPHDTDVIIDHGRRALPPDNAQAP